MYNSKLNPDKGQWDAFVSAHPRGHFLQTSAWADVKADFGWSSQIISLLNSSGDIVAGSQILYRDLPFSIGKMAYVPFGPLVDWSDSTMVQDMFLMMDRTAKRNDAKFLKLEPGYDIDTNTLQKLGNRPSSQTIQPPRTILIDIRKQDQNGKPISEDDILARMNQMTRRNIRKSTQKNVEIREGTREDVNKFNKLLQTTSERQDFGVHVPEYYEKVYDYIVANPEPPDGVLLMASYTDEETGDTQDLGGVFIFAIAGTAYYVYGASSSIERDRMASFGLQWAAVQWSRKHKAKGYDMYGVPDEAATILENNFTERSDGLWGVYRFKRGWGGEVVRTVGTWDRVYNPLIYRLYRGYLFIRETRENGPE
ncbi:MAG: aminoacyltransferase [Chloroflexi bacterium]|nr:aminoacyltransferase [Chloroflexota bacterium]